jgi:hypothetical protein
VKQAPEGGSREEREVLDGNQDSAHALDDGLDYSHDGAPRRGIAIGPVADHPPRALAPPPSPSASA